MKVPRKDAARTRKRLLAAAGDAFAEQGYRTTTIGEICKRARTNIAAVNYHFGSKAGLYAEAWRHAFLESVKVHPADGGVPDDAPAERRLRGRVTALLHRIADQGNKEFWIVQKELVDSTGILDEAMEEVLQPLSEKMDALVRELLGPSAPEPQVHCCVISIISQCINPMVAGRARRSKGNGNEDFAEIEDIEAYADHVTKFSLAGIRALRRERAAKRRKSAKSK